MLYPLGMTEKEYKQRNRGIKYWKQFKAWRKGYEAGKNSGSKQDNPYNLTPEQWKLLRKRTMWMLGFEDGDHYRHFKKLKKRHKKDYSKRKHKHEKD